MSTTWPEGMTRGDYAQELAKRWDEIVAASPEYQRLAQEKPEAIAKMRREYIVQAAEPMPGIEQKQVTDAERRQFWGGRDLTTAQSIARNIFYGASSAAIDVVEGLGADKEAVGRARQSLDKGVYEELPFWLWAGGVQWDDMSKSAAKELGMGKPGLEEALYYWFVDSKDIASAIFGGPGLLETAHLVPKAEPKRFAGKAGKLTAEAGEFFAGMFGLSRYAIGVKGLLGISKLPLLPALAARSMTAAAVSEAGKTEPNVRRFATNAVTYFGIIGASQGVSNLLMKGIAASPVGKWMGKLMAGGRMSRAWGKTLKAIGWPAKYTLVDRADDWVESVFDAGWWSLFQRPEGSSLVGAFFSALPASLFWNYLTESVGQMPGVVRMSAYSKAAKARKKMTEEDVVKEWDGLRQDTIRMVDKALTDAAVVGVEPTKKEAALIEAHRAVTNDPIKFRQAVEKGKLPDLAPVMTRLAEEGMVREEVAEEVKVDEEVVAAETEREAEVERLDVGRAVVPVEADSKGQQQVVRDVYESFLKDDPRYRITDGGDLMVPVSEATSFHAVLQRQIDEYIGEKKHGLATSARSLREKAAAIGRAAAQAVMKPPPRITVPKLDIVDQASLEEFGNAMIGALGITEPIEWVFTPRTFPIGRYHPRSVEGPARLEIADIRGKTEWGSPEELQGIIRSTIVHELAHSKVPSIRVAQGGTTVRQSHHPEFWATYAYDMMLLYDAMEAEIEASEPAPGPGDVAPVDGIGTPPVDVEPGDVEVPGEPSDEPSAGDLRDQFEKDQLDGFLGRTRMWIKRRWERLQNVEKAFAIEGLPDTGKQVKISPGEVLTEQARAVLTAKRLSKASSMGLVDWMEATYCAAHPLRLKQLRGKRLARIKKVLPIARLYLKEAAARQMKVGAFKEEWPGSYIHRANIRLGELQDAIFNARTEKAKARYEREIAEITDNILFLKQQKVQYVPITRVWLERAYETDPIRARRVISNFYRTRKTVNIVALAEYLLEEKLLRREDVDLRGVILAYGDKVGKVISAYKVAKVAYAEGGIVPKVEHPTWEDATYAMHSAIGKSKSKSPHVVHPLLWKYAVEMRKHGGLAGTWRVFALFKGLRFINPLYLHKNDMEQAFYLGLTRHPLAPLYMVRAGLSMARKDDVFWRAMPILFSTPFVMPFETYMRKGRSAMFRGGRAGHLLKMLRVSLFQSKLPFFTPWNTVMAPLWDAAWSGDRFLRLMGLHFLMARGMPLEEAAHVAAKFFGDYANCPPQTRRVLNKIFFTPTFPIVMGQLQFEMLTSFGMVMKNTMRMRKSSRREWRMAQGIFGMLAWIALRDAIMTMLGYKAARLGLQYVKRVMDERGREKELVINTPTSDNVVWRWGISAWGVVTGKDLEEKITRASYRLHPIWQLAIQSVQNRTLAFKPIHNPFDSDYEIGRDYVSWVLPEMAPIFRVFPDMVPEARMEAHRAMKHDLGRLYPIMRPFIFANMRGTKRERLLYELQELEKDFIYYMRTSPADTLEQHDRRLDRLRGRIEEVMKEMREEGK